MKFVIQRVDGASVAIDGRVHCKIGKGLVVLVGIHKDDRIGDCARHVDKILKLRIFADAEKPINASIRDVDGEALLISQFTLIADLKGQNRPSFIDAAKPAEARAIYDEFVLLFAAAWPKTKSGVFAADMRVSLINDGPVTIVME